MITPKRENSIQTTEKQDEKFLEIKTPQRECVHTFDRSNDTKMPYVWMDFT